MKWVVCTDNSGYAASLDVHKRYQRVDDQQAETLGLLRVMDESGDSYLYPREMFSPVEIAPLPLMGEGLGRG